MMMGTIGWTTLTSERQLLPLCSRCFPMYVFLITGTCIMHYAWKKSIMAWVSEIVNKVFLSTICVKWIWVIARNSALLDNWQCCLGLATRWPMDHSKLHGLLPLPSALDMLLLFGHPWVPYQLQRHSQRVTWTENRNKWMEHEYPHNLDPQFNNKQVIEFILISDSKLVQAMWVMSFNYFARMLSYTSIWL